MFDLLLFVGCVVTKLGNHDNSQIVHIISNCIRWIFSLLYILFFVCVGQDAISSPSALTPLSLVFRTLLNPFFYDPSSSLSIFNAPIAPFISFLTHFSLFSLFIPPSAHFLSSVTHPSSPVCGVEAQVPRTGVVAPHEPFAGLTGSVTAVELRGVGGDSCCKWGGGDNKC